MWDTPKIKPPVYFHKNLITFKFSDQKFFPQADVTTGFFKYKNDE